MKKFDAKEFLMAKGERVALGICGLIMVILLGSGLAEGMGSSTAEENAKALNKSSDILQGMQASARPTEAQKPPKDEDPERLTLYAAREKVQPEPYDTPDLIHRQEQTIEDKRGRPEVYSPGPLIGKAVLVPLRLIDFEARYQGRKRNITKVKLITGGGYTSLLSKKAGNDFFGGIGNEQYGDTREPGADINNDPYQIPSPPGFSGVGGGKAGLGFGNGRLGQDNFFGQDGSLPDIDTKKNAKLTVETIEVAKLQKNEVLNYAEQVFPQRMIVVAGSFPFGKQVREFADKLKMTPQQVLSRSETIKVKDETGKERTLPAFYFRDLIVERKAFNPAGAVVEDWRPLDYKDQYRELILRTNDTFVEDSEEIQKIKRYSPRLCLDLPAAWGDEEDPLGSNLYPKLAANLEEIKTTIEQLRDKKEESVAKPPGLFENTRDPFSLPEEPKRNPGRDPNDPTNFNPDQFNDVGPGQDPRNPRTTQREFVLPEHVLIRFVDYKVRPGLHYKYRLYLKMNNPNFGRDDITYPELTKDEILTSPPREMEGVVKMPQEQVYYAVDQRTSDKLLEKDSKWKDYEGVKNPETEAVMQIHRWVDSYPGTIKSQDGSDLRAVGEWLVANYYKVHRGEYIGRLHETLVPVKPLKFQSHVLGRQKNDSAKKKRDELEYLLARRKITKKRYNELIGLIEKIVQVPFGDASLLVDIDGGKEEYEWVKRDDDGDVVSRTDYSQETSRELAFLRPDGRLAVHSDYSARLQERELDSATFLTPVERKDERERRERRKAWYERLTELSKLEKSNTIPDPSGQPGTDDFNPFGQQGGGGNDCGGSDEDF